MVLGGVFANFLTFNSLSNVNLFSGAPIHSLNVGTYTNQPGDVITTAWIDYLNCTGDFGANLVINGGFGPFRRGLNSAVIGGSVGNADWRILANVGSVKVGSVPAGWTGSVRGSVQSFIDLGDYAGQLAAHSITLFQVNGNMTSASVLTGADFGNDGRIGGGDDTFGRGILTRFNVGGSVTNSVVAAGLQPVGTTLLAPGTILLPRSAIRSVTIAGTIDDSSRVLAVVLPKTASINGSQVATAGDVNFG